MAKKSRSFYEATSYTGYLHEGSQINVQRQIIYHGDNADFTPFLEVPHKELEKRLKDSIAEEKKVFNDTQEKLKAWDGHGAQTLLLKKAIEYLKTPTVEHTTNEWKQGKDGTWEISNLVYKMTFKIKKNGDEWKLAWELQYTAPGLSKDHYYYPSDTTPRKRIEYEGSKKYKTKEGAQKYVQGKFDQYISCFEALSPPVPVQVKSLFCVNGQLLQGYSVASPEVKKQKEPTLDDLLSCLGDEDVAPTAAPTPAALEPPPKVTPPKSHAHKPTNHKHKKKTVPGR